MLRIGGVGKSQEDADLSLVDDILEMLHDSVTTGHMGVPRTLACVHLRFYW